MLILVLTLNCIIYNAMVETSSLASRHAVPFHWSRWDAFISDQALNCTGKDTIKVEDFLELEIVPPDNCEPHFDKVTYGLCHFNFGSPPTSFAMQVSYEGDSRRATEIFGVNDEEIQYNQSETRLATLQGECVPQRTARLRITPDIWSGEIASLRCNWNFLTKETEIHKTYRACPPTMETSVHLDIPLASITLGTPLSFTCEAAVGSGGKLTWALRTDRGQVHIINTKAHLIKYISIKYEEMTSAVHGPTVTSTLKMSIPRHYNNSVVACVSGPRPSVVNFTGESPVVSISEPINIILPKESPSVTIYYHDRDNILYIGEVLRATCTANMNKHGTKDLSWRLEVADQTYEWSVSRNGVLQTKNTSPDLMLHAFVQLIDVVRDSNKGAEYWAIELILSVTSQEFHDTDQGTLNCFQNKTQDLGVRVEGEAEYFNIKYPPQAVSLTREYVSRDSLPHLKVVCKAYVGTDGLLVWWLANEPRLNITWGFDVKTKRFGQTWEGVKLLAPRTFFDQKHGPGLTTSAVIRINYQTDGAKVQCAAAKLWEVDVESDHRYREFFNSTIIKVADATRHYTRLWNLSSLKKTGWVLLILLLTLLVVAMVMVASNFLCASMMEDDLSSSGSRDSQNYSIDSSMVRMSLNLDFDGTKSFKK